MPPQFQTETQAKVYANVAQILKDQFGAQARPNDQAPQFNIRAGSAFVTVVVSPINDKATVVRAYSWVVTGAESSTELRQFLLEQNFNMRFGGYATEPGTGDILFTHAVLGEGLDTDELMWTVMAVANTADEADDQIVQRFGGQRAVDRT